MNIAVDICRASAVVFDLDGTLVDSAGDIAAACNAALQAVGRAPLPASVVRTFVGDGARMLLARALAVAPTDALVDRALDAFRAYYDAHPTDNTTILPGALELLEHLRRLPLAVVTNKPRATAELVLERLSLRPRFAAVRGGGDGPLKPDPTLTLEVLRALGAAPNEAWFVGDGPQDVGAGRAAGCVTVAVLGIADEAALIGARPDYVVSSLAELVSRADDA